MMITKRNLLIPLGLVLLLLLLLIPAEMIISAAPTYSAYDIDWWTIDGGGAQSSGGGFMLMGTIGQADAFYPLSGGGYTLEGGYWPGANPPSLIFMPLVRK
jgi:hypothetical protein